MPSDSLIVALRTHVDSLTARIHALESVAVARQEAARTADYIAMMDRLGTTYERHLDHTLWMIAIGVAVVGLLVGGLVPYVLARVQRRLFRRQTEEVLETIAQRRGELETAFEAAMDRVSTAAATAMAGVMFEQAQLQSSLESFATAASSALAAVSYAASGGQMDIARRALRIAETTVRLAGASGQEWKRADLERADDAVARLDGLDLAESEKIRAIAVADRIRAAVESHADAVGPPPDERLE